MYAFTVNTHDVTVEAETAEGVTRLLLDLLPSTDYALVHYLEVALNTADLVSVAECLEALDIDVDKLPAHLLAETIDVPVALAHLAAEVPA